MRVLLRTTTGIIVAFGAFVWGVFLVQLYEKAVHPHQKNLNGDEFYGVGLILTFLTVMAYLGLHSARKSYEKRSNETRNNH